MCKLSDCLTFRRIDIMITKPVEYPFAILYFTGSKDFNTLMRQHALDKGYSMNEYSLKHVSDKSVVDKPVVDKPVVDKPVVDHTFKTEKDIFDFLEYSYVDPWNR